MFHVEELNCNYAKSVEFLHFSDKFAKFVDSRDPKKFCILPENMNSVIEKMKSMEIYDDDVWVITNPKSGTTLTQEMVWLLVNDLNFETASTTDLDFRVPFIEAEGLKPGSPFIPPFFQMATDLKRPRTIKSHLPAFLLPDGVINGKAKVVYVVRNPKDAAVSFYHHHVNLHGWKGSLQTFIDAFVNDRMFYSPFNDHVLEFYEMRNNPNILFLYFEDMRKDLKSVVERVATFLGKSYSPEDLDKLCDHLSFNKMRENQMTNKARAIGMVKKIQGREDEEDWNFIRKGKVGSYKEELTPEQNELLDSYVKQIDGKTSFRYKFE